MSVLFEQVRDFVEASFGEQKMAYFDRTVYWVTVLKPEADEAMLIAAVSHDLGRALFSEEQKALLEKYSFISDEFLFFHQEKSAEAITGFLKEKEAEIELIRKVKFLVMQHEFGGNEDQNILKDADSISFFETNAQSFVEKKTTVGVARVKEKFEWMFFRISSAQAREIAAPLYEKAVNQLESNE